MAVTLQLSTPLLPPPAQKPIHPRVDLQALMLAAVSEKTGYPAEMLELGMDLEGDLGIDSIKRVEIIAAFRKQVIPGMDEPPEEYMERMSAVQSITDIVAVMEDFVESGATAEPAREAAAAVATDPAPESAPASIDAGCGAIFRMYESSKTRLLTTTPSRDA